MICERSRTGSCAPAGSGGGGGGGARGGRVERRLPGSLVRRARRCSSSGCRCRRGELHGPYLYVALYLGGRNRTLYVPGACEAAVVEHVEVTHANQAALEEIARVNVELLRRRALG